MDILQSLSIDPSVLKEPKGFIRVIQFVLSILAFATITSVNTASKIAVACNNDSSTQVQIKYGYPFRIKNSEVSVPFCGGGAQPSDDVFAGSVSGSAEFFCFVGVMSFLFCLVLVLAYVGFSQVFASNRLLAKVDFIGSAVWTVIWFIACAAWADGLSKLGDYTKPSQLITDLTMKNYCGNGVKCTAVMGGDHSTLVVSVLFGFLNMGVWGASLWFLYKETDWHRDKPADGQQEGFDQPYATQDYHPQEYQTDPSVPTTPTAPNY